MKVLFTSPILEHPAAGGPQLRIENSIKALSRICDLYIVSRAIASDAQRLHTEDYFKPYCQEFTHLPRVTKDPARNRLVRIASRLYQRAFDSNTPSDADFILQCLDRIRADAIWFGYGNISYGLMKRIRRLRPSLPMVCDTDSVWSRFVLRELPHTRGIRKIRIARAGRRKEKEEREWTNFCTVTTAVSDVDAEYYRQLTADKQSVRVFRNVIDVDSYAVRPRVPAGFKSPCIYLAGTFGHFNSPMDSAARWVLDEVFPILLERIPTLHFYIVGNNSDRGFGHLNGPNITATGRLESVLPYLVHADVALVPLKFESGTRFKILEAGACEIPLVSTTLGAEGIPVVDGRHILIADDAKGFADSILRLIADKAFARDMAARCNELVREGFSIDSLAREGSEILAYIGGTRRLTS